MPTGGMAVCNRTAGADKSERLEVSSRRSRCSPPRGRLESGLVFRRFWGGQQGHQVMFYISQTDMFILHKTARVAGLGMTADCAR